MTKKDLNEILDYVELNYNDFNDSMRNEWAKKMIFYDKKLVLEALEKIMSDEFYQRKLPTLTYICEDYQNLMKLKVLKIEECYVIFAEDHLKMSKKWTNTIKDVAAYLLSNEKQKNTRG